MKNTRITRFFSLLLALVMVAGLMPMTQVAYAAGTDKAIQLVESATAANIAGGQESIIYFGNYNQGVVSLSPKTFSVDPIKWRVLENETGNLFLLSDHILDQSAYNTVYRHTGTGSSGHAAFQAEGAGKQAFIRMGPRHRRT